MTLRKSMERFKAQPPKSLMNIVILRTTTIMILLLTAILINLSVLLRPWKAEFLEGDSKRFEFSIFHICRITGKGGKCYEGELDDAPAWFLTFRWFLLIATIFGYISFFIPIIQLLRMQRKRIPIFLSSAYLSLVSGVLTITAQLLLIGYWDFEFLDESRQYRMGWKEDLETDESVGFPMKMAWGACVMFFINFIICLYAHFKDKAFMKAFEKHSLQLKANKLMNGN